jgi:Raf kinase inhibitor-like YbhB/YbcL family protein
MQKKISVVILLFTLFTSAYAAEFTIQSPAFADFTSIPKQFTCDGTNHSPPLTWQNPPDNTQSFVIIVDDPDALNGVWVHWIAINIPGDATQLAEDAKLSAPAVNGKNGWGNSRYEGPCPPRGTNRYHYRLYALDTQLKLDEGASVQDVNSAMKKHILGHCELIGLYR